MKKFLIFFSIILLLICIGIFSSSFGNEENKKENTEYSIGTVTAESLRIRSGLSTEDAYTGLLAKNDVVHIYGKVEDWYIVKTENNKVGAVFADYINISYENEETIETSSQPQDTENLNSSLLSQDEQVFLNLINNKRIENNLPELQIDENLQNVARLKCQDIVKNQYFSHTSPTYGTFFEMLEYHNISYSKASENIAKNNNADNALASLMSSESHKNNILSTDFNYTGIAVLNSVNYGKVFVEMFVAK